MMKKVRLFHDVFVGRLANKATNEHEKRERDLDQESESAEQEADDEKQEPGEHQVIACPVCLYSLIL